MQERPAIKTALPKRRYQIGSHTASLLGEIESGEACSYRYILAFVPAGQTEPVLYVCSEATPSAERADGTYRLRIVSELMRDIVDTDERWGDLESFAEQALKLGVQVLGLQDTQVVRLM